MFQSFDSIAILVSDGKCVHPRIKKQAKDEQGTKTT